MKTCLSQNRVWFNLVVGVLLLGVLLLSAPIAVTAQEPIVLVGFCPFDVQLDVTVDNTKTIETRGGIFITTGALKARLTNLESLATVDLNVPGPGRVVSNADGTTAYYSGPWLLGVPAGVLPGFEPRLFFSKGRVIAEIDATGTFTSLTIQGGKVIDLCAALSE
jgi:hypothetical protein